MKLLGLKYIKIMLVGLLWTVMAWQSLAWVPASLAAGSIIKRPSDKDLEAYKRYQILKVYVKFHDGMRESKWKDMVTNLIRLREKSFFDPDTYRESLNALMESKQFKKIESHMQALPNGLNIYLDLYPYHYIKDIKLSHIYPYFEQELTNAMTIYAGDVYRHQEVMDQIPILQKMFMQEGYIHPGVTVTEQTDPDDGNYIIYYQIDKGAYYRLKSLSITGNQAISDKKLRIKFLSYYESKLFPGNLGRFVEKEFKDEVKAVRTYYWAHEYPEAKATYLLEKDPEHKTISAKVTIEEGAKYEILFSGNDSFMDYTLKKDIVAFKKGIDADYELRRSIRNIKERYKSYGFSDTQIQFDETVLKDQGRITRQITLKIAEGPKTIVDSIEISGNTVISSDDIKSQMRTRPPGFLNLFEKGYYIVDNLTEDLSTIKTLYLRKGYPNAQVTKQVILKKDQTRADIKIFIREGEQILVSSVQIDGLEASEEKKAMQVLAMPPGSPFRQYLVKNDENELSAMIAEKGYPHVTVKSKVTKDVKLGKADIVYQIDKGPFVKMGQIFFSGNLRTKDRTIKREIEMEPGDPFSLKKILNAQRNIRNMDIFNAVSFRPIGLVEKQKNVDIFIDLEEKKPFFFNAGGGYESETGFYTKSRIGDHNLMGKYKEGSAGMEISQTGYNMDVSVTEPRFLGSRIYSTYEVYGEKKEEYNKDFGIRVKGATAGFKYKWPYHITTGLGFNYERREQFLRENGYVADPTELDPRSIIVTTPYISYDTRDSFIRPQKGFFSTISVTVSNGLLNSLDDFYKIEGDLRTYVTPVKRLTFATIGRSGYLDSYGSADKVPDDQLFFLGGTSTVRGYKENLLRSDSVGNPLGGQSMLLGSVEARYYLGHNIEMALFYDIGSVFNPFDTSQTKKFRASTGIGIRYLTGIGPIGIFYGHKLDRQENESAGRFHFSMGYTF